MSNNGMVEALRQISSLSELQRNHIQGLSLAIAGALSTAVEYYGGKDYNNYVTWAAEVFYEYMMGWLYKLKNELIAFVMKEKVSCMFF